MKIVKILILGFLSGLLYAFISFYLITPYLRENLTAIGFFGLQGLLFSLAFICLKSLLTKSSVGGKDSHRLRRNIIIGAISGLISGSFNICVTYYSAVISFPGTVASELEKNILSQLIHYSFGCIVVGSTIGILVSFIKHRGKTLTSK